MNGIDVGVTWEDKRHSISTCDDSKVKQGLCHTLALPFTLKSILRQKKNYGNKNIFHNAKNIIFKKSSKTKKPKSFKILKLYDD